MLQFWLCQGKQHQCNSGFSWQQHWLNFVCVCFCTQSNAQSHWKRAATIDSFMRFKGSKSVTTRSKSIWALFLAITRRCWTWKTPNTNVHRLLPLLSHPRGHETDFSGAKQHESSTHTNDIIWRTHHHTPFTQKTMTSLIKVVSNCSWNTTLCHWPTKATERHYVGISHGLALRALFV